MIAVYPGSFDPITLGHFDIIERASSVFEKVIVVVAVNSAKTSAFSPEQRSDMIQRSIDEAGIKNVVVDCFSNGLLVDYVERSEAKVIVKGLRALSDFEYEFQMALLNRHMKAEIETVFMMTRAEYSYLSSSIVREIARLGGEISGLVPNTIIPTIYAGLGHSGGTDIRAD